jgi:NAD(P)-dependent dehydrogenase (short-subunit alcohol dehydrogenase family)
VAPRDRSTPWAAKGRVAGPALLERGLELIEETLGPVDILVNNGGIALKKDALDVSKLRRWWIEGAPMRRYAEVEESGPAVVFLAGGASSFVTGSVLVMAGGHTLF